VEQTYGLIGEHFKNPATCGGGSSETMPFYVSTPLDAVREVLGEERFKNVKYEPGCYSE
jgi:beta-glucosidase